MEKLYKANYNDGTMSRGIVVDFAIRSEGIQLWTTNGETLFWQKNLIRVHESKRQFLSLHVGEQKPYAQLDITDLHSVELCRALLGLKPIRKRSLRAWPIVGIIIAIVIGFVWLCYSWLLPFVADTAARFVPVEYEVNMGKQLLESQLEHEKIDSAKTRVINLYFKQLVIKSDYPVNITVVESDIVNAFALPGGPIVVYTGILKKMNKHEQLAALLSHEFSHVELRHATRNIFRSLSGYVLLSLVVGDMGGVTSTILQHTENLRALSYTRSLEAEADKNGLEILKTNAIDAKGMIALFEILKKESQVEVNEWFSTHPDIDSRIESVKTYINEQQLKTETNDSLVLFFKSLKQ